jgi:type IX secretion system PorP/SprF family membrane protein
MLNYVIEMKSNPMKRVVLACALLSSMGLSAQQDVMISQYMFNNLFLNPAYAGLNDHFTSTLLHRSQWTHLEGAPRTSILGADGSLSAGKMGLGMTLKHDQLGVTKDIEIGTQYAYHLRLNSTNRLSFGIKGAVSLYSAELTSLTTWDSGDPTFQNDIQNAAVSKIGFGVIWSSSRTYAGISIPSLYANDGSVSSQLAGQNGELFDQHYYLQAGHVVNVNEHIALKPSVLIKYEQAAPVDVDMNLNLLYKDFLWLGAGWRAGDAIVAMLEYQVLPELRIGYAYDMTTSLLNNYSNGSHEVMIGFDMAKEQVKLKNPRYF